jgi:hypothetical protein
MPKLNPGEAVMIKHTSNANIPFTWNVSSTRGSSKNYVHPTPVYYEYVEQLDYIPIFIDLSEANVVFNNGEIGLFINDVCYGATVVYGETVQVCAYIHETEIAENTQVEFRYHEYNSRSPEKVLKGYQVYNDKAKVFEAKKLDLRTKEMYYMVSFGNDGSFENEVVPFVTSLGNNYPNPFNPSTTISYSLGEAGTVKLSIYNIKGQLVKTLVNEEKEPGRYNVVWSGEDNHTGKVASGVYFYRMETKAGHEIKKMLLLK